MAAAVAAAASAPSEKREREPVCGSENGEAVSKRPRPLVAAEVEADVCVPVLTTRDDALTGARFVVFVVASRSRCASRRSSTHIPQLTCVHVAPLQTTIRSARR
jgi:hypothetical protein